MSARVDEHKFKSLLQQRADSAERTSRRLHEALDRFEQNNLTYLPKDSKLTVRNLALEAGVNKDTPLSRYPRRHPNAGRYRFPDVVDRFRELIAKKVKPPIEERKKNKIQELQEIIKNKNERELLSARVNNQLDAENVALKHRNHELEEEVVRLREENAELRQGKMTIVTFGKT